MTGLFPSLASARFSADRTHRYELWRDLGTGSGTVCFIMLNPSVADELEDDLTIKICKARVAAMGYRKLVVVNLYSFISTDPSALYEDTEDKTGNPENLQTIVRVASAADRIIAAWGAHATKLHRAGSQQAARVMQAFLGRLECLAINDEGTPHHPTRLRKDLPIQPYHYLPKER